jgi:hypothetical protein
VIFVSEPVAQKLPQLFSHERHNLPSPCAPISPPRRRKCGNHSSSGREVRLHSSLQKMPPPSSSLTLPRALLLVSLLLLGATTLFSTSPGMARMHMASLGSGAVQGDGWRPDGRWALLVVARAEGEDVGWVRDTPTTLAVVVYNKGRTPVGFPCVGRIVCVHLPDLGGPEETYLTAMLENVLRAGLEGVDDDGFDTSQPHTLIFARGDPFSASPDYRKRLLSLVQFVEAKAEGLSPFSGLEPFVTENPPGVRHPGGSLRPALRATFNLTVGGLPKSLVVYPGGLFAMSRDRIRSLGTRGHFPGGAGAQAPLGTGRAFILELRRRLLEAEGAVAPSCSAPQVRKQPCGCLNPFSPYTLLRLFPYM